jgi:mRNA interferase MazF
MMINRRDNVKNVEVSTWEIWNVDLGTPTMESVQGGIRPVVIIQNNIGNKYCSTVNVLPMTSQLNKNKKDLPMHVLIKADEAGLYSDSTVMPEQIQTIHKSRLDFKISDVPPYMIDSIKEAMMIQYSIH